MIQHLKKRVSRSPFLKKLLLPLYLGAGGFIFWIYKKNYKSFSYKLLNKQRVRFYPDGQIARGIFLGGFENNELAILQAVLKKGSVMIDAGTNIGLYSIIGSRLAGSSGKIFSFEPSKSNYHLLLKNIKLNKAENIVAINKGLGDKVGEQLFLAQNEQTGDAEKFIARDEKGLATVQNTEEIIIETLDNFLLNNHMPQIDFLKIDVEGFEYYVLKGAKNLLNSNPELIILFECAEHLAKRGGASQHAVIDLLHQAGFQIAAWDEKLNKWNTEIQENKNSGQFLAGKKSGKALHKLLQQLPEN